MVLSCGLLPIERLSPSRVRTIVIGIFDGVRATDYCWLLPPVTAIGFAPMQRVTMLINVALRPGSLVRVLSVVLAGCTICAPACGTAPFRVVAREQGTAPGLDGATFVQSFGIGNDWAVINNDGQVAFTARLAGGTNGPSLWLTDGDRLRLIGVVGQPVPGLAQGAYFGSFSQFSLGNGGTLAFQAATYRIEPSLEIDQGIWFRDSNGVHLVAASDMDVPGSAGDIVFSNFSLVQSGGRLDTMKGGFLGFQAQVRAASDLPSYFDPFGVFRYGSTGLESVALPGQQVPGTPLGRVFGDGASYVRTNSDGLVSIYYGSLLTDDGAVMERFLGHGDDVPGFAPNVVFVHIGLFYGVDAAGRYAFHGRAGERRNDGFVFGNESVGLWTGVRESIEPIILPGDRAPGVPGSFVFDRIGLVASSNTLSGIAFSAALRDDSDKDLALRGIWVWEQGRLSSVAVVGDPAPDTDQHTTFASLPSLPNGLAINARNEVVFFAKLQGSDVDPTNDTGIWARGRDGRLRLVVREGDLLPLGNGEYATLGEIDSKASESWFNDFGQIVIHANFTDAPPAILVFDANVVPEPTGAVLIVVAAVSTIIRSSCTRWGKRVQV